MKNFVKLTCLVLCVFMAFTAAACGGAKNYAENNTKFKIGISGPLTGPAAIYGNACKNSAQMAVDEINANGGVAGMQLELIALDDINDPSKIATNYTSMYESGMQASLGCVTTKPCLEFKEYAFEDNVFFVTPSASADAVVTHPNAFQMCFADTEQGTASANLFNANYKGKKVGILYRSDDDYSTGIYNTFNTALDASFKADLKVASFVGDTVTSFTSQIELLKNSDIIFMPIYYTPAQLFMTQGASTIKANAIYFGCDGFDGINLESISTISQEVSYLSHFNSTATTGPVVEYLNAYNAKFDEDAQPTNQFGASSYDCVYAIAAALEQAKADGKTFDVTTSASVYGDILKEVFTSEGFVFHGITGECIGDSKSNISWNEDGKVHKQAIKYIVKEATAA